MERPDQAGSAGFTLMEMLVVMLIAGIAIALASQALGQYQRAVARTVASERGTRELRLSEAWIRQSIRGLYPLSPLPGPGTRDSEAGTFRGDADGFSGTTLSPVLGGQGIPTTQSWRVVRTGGTDGLELEEAGTTVSMQLPPSRGLRFHYMGPDGKLQDQWPPKLGKWEQLPQAVVLEMPPRDPALPVMVIAAPIVGTRTPIDIPYEPSTD
jgi:prepilin-type N-terminal cleavage/methylation domain-containing protein